MCDCVIRPLGLEVSPQCSIGHGPGLHHQSFPLHKGNETMALIVRFVRYHILKFGVCRERQIIIENEFDRNNPY